MAQYTPSKGSSVSEPCSFHMLKNHEVSNAGTLKLPTPASFIMHIGLCACFLRRSLRGHLWFFSSAADGLKFPFK